ncbi:PilZ domain-containing protein [Paludisphaera borealis]|nr:PilZ domain-containing protein [Paludisphaera borealis]
MQHDEKRAARRANQGSQGPHVSLERRASPRLPAVDERIWAGWWVDDDEFTTTAARLENISRGGAKVRTTVAPDVSQDVWIRLADPSCSDFVQATVLEVVPTPEGDFGVRMVFDEPCPDEFFDIVTKGYYVHDFADSMTDA